MPEIHFARDTLTRAREDAYGAMRHWVTDRSLYRGERPFGDVNGDVTLYAAPSFIDPDEWLALSMEKRALARDVMRDLALAVEDEVRRIDVFLSQLPEDAPQAEAHQDMMQDWLGGWRDLRDWLREMERP